MHRPYVKHGGLPGTSGASVSILHVEKRYGPVPAVGGVSLEVTAGEFVSLLGPSGSGKTTILMLIAGFEAPDSGAIVVGGRDVTDVPANRRNIGMVFQRYALFPHMTVAENIGFPLKMRRIARREIAARVEEALALVRLEGYGGRLPAHLSGGQQQRVALARAIVFRPPILLMDEPLAALDKKLRQAVQLELKRLQKDLGLTVVYVTHDQEEALTMSDRIAVLNRGRVEQVGRPEELYETPANAFVADFIGETNFLRGEVIALENAVCAVRVHPNAIVCAQAAAELAPGMAARVAVRPERVRLGPSGTGLSGTVTDRVYGGATVTYVVRVAPAIELMARCSGGAWAGWEIGEHVGVSWQPQEARTYRAPAP